MVNTIIFTAFGLLISIIGWFIKKSYDRVDTKLNSIETFIEGAKEKQGVDKTKFEEISEKFNNHEKRLDSHAGSIKEIDRRLVTIESQQRINHG